MTDSREVSGVSVWVRKQTSGGEDQFILLIEQSLLAKLPIRLPSPMHAGMTVEVFFRGASQSRGRRVYDEAPRLGINAEKNEAIYLFAQQEWVRQGRPVKHWVQWDSAKLLITIADDGRANITLRIEDPVDPSPLAADDGYFRLVGERLDHILELHRALARRFSAWLLTSGYKHIQCEVDRVDVEFEAAGVLCRAELKACGDIGPRRSIREALGQLLEYNLYGVRAQALNWWIVLDEEPSSDDVAFLARVQDLIGERARLHLAWWSAGEEAESFTVRTW